MGKPLYRSRKESVAGVCQGLADWSGVSVGVIRLIFIIGIVIWGAALPIYILLAIFLPKEPKHNESVFEDSYENHKESETIHDGFRELRTGVQKFASSVKREFTDAFQQESKNHEHTSSKGRDEAKFYGDENSANKKPSETINEEVERLKRKYGGAKPEDLNDNLANEARQKQKESDWDSKFHDS